jgi:hypothetical protein
MLNLAEQHSLEIDDGRPTVRPSILAADAGCLSHFWLTRGRVTGAEQWSVTEVKQVMNAQLHQHLERTSAKHLPWWMRVIRAIRRLLLGSG